MISMGASATPCRLSPPAQGGPCARSIRERFAHPAAARLRRAACASQRILPDVWAAPFGEADPMSASVERQAVPQKDTDARSLRGSVIINGREVAVEWTARAERAMRARPQP